MKIQYLNGEQRIPRKPETSSPRDATSAQAFSHAYFARCAGEIYPQGDAGGAGDDAPDAFFVDADLDLRANARKFGDSAHLTFRGTIGTLLISPNWRKVNFVAKFNSDVPPRHTGFVNAWLALKPYVERWLRDNKIKSIALIGHSLGAALAQLAAFDLCREWTVTEIVVFASPRLGDCRFNDAYATQPVAGADLCLGQRTTRYLLLSDGIFGGYLKRFGYEAPPHVRIDEYGRESPNIPPFFDRLLHALSGAHSFKAVGLPGRLRRPPKAEPILPREQQINAARWTLWPALGGAAGLAAALTASAIGARQRDWGFHEMERYERAMQWKASASTAPGA